MSKHSRSKTVWRVVLAVASVLVIVALVAVAAVMFLLRPVPSMTVPSCRTPVCCRLPMERERLPR